MKKKGSIPYRLWADESLGVLCASGPSEIIYDQLLRIPGAQFWKHTIDFVSVPITRASFMGLESVASPEWCSDEYMAIRSKWMKPDNQQIDMFLRSLELGGGDSSKLLDYQIWAGSIATKNSRGLLNGSEQGTGKTRSTLASIAALGAKKSIVVAPPTVCIEWAKEARKPDGIFKGSPPFYALTYASGPVDWRCSEIYEWLARPEPVCIAVNYESLQKVIKRIQPLLNVNKVDLCVADESHWIKNPKSKNSLSFKELAASSRYTFCTSGTPVGNDIGDFFPQIDSIAPNILSTNYSDYMARYAIYKSQKIYTKHGEKTISKVCGARDLQDLMLRMEPFYFRATKAAVLNLPPINYELVTFDLPTSVKALYKDVLERGEEVFDSLSLSGAMVRDTRLMQICGGFSPSKSGDWDDPDENSSGIVLLESPKIEWIKNFCKDRLKHNPTHRCVIWCRHTITLMRITDELQKILGSGGRVSYVKGGSPWVDDAIDSLNSRDPYGVQVIVAQIKSISEGKQLQGADSMIYAEKTWSYFARSQTESRAHRMGRLTGVSIWDLSYIDTIDIQVDDAMAAKQDFASRTSPDTTY